ncbi:MAG: HAMP domain-containing histidine kinase [Myxococcales bacterium]|nr:HAMP domain-containing histidine kinase [Myxococcales bacterium]
MRGRWLARVRLVAAVAQMGLVATGFYALGVPRAWPVLLALLGLGVASNFHFRRSIARQVPIERTFSVALVTDVVVLTALLHGTGGATNPFSVFYLVYVALAAIVLTGRRAMSIAVLTMVAFATLFVRGSAAEEMQRLHHGAAFSLHLYGMWFAYVLAAAIVGTFIARLVLELRTRERELAEAQEARARAERVAALGTLAAGAAHELATPLGTIAIVAKELSRAAAEQFDSMAVAEDAQLLRAEVERCRRIVGDLAGKSGGDLAGAPLPSSVGVVFDAVRDALGPEATKVRFEGDDRATLRVPQRALVRALVNLVRNALDAAGAAELRSDKQAGHVRFTVHDAGPGLPPEVLTHLAEPFFTTKGGDRGMGLGLYLARSFADASGGQLSVATGGGGSTFVLEVPAEVA